MRLFIAVNLDRPTREALAGVMDGLRKSGARGRYTDPENLHITLSFLGEQPRERIPALRRAMEKAAGSPFAIALSGLGRFRRPDGDILWAGIREDGSLSALQKRLTASLRQEGFPTESRGFTPHLTLSRAFAQNRDTPLPDFPSRTLAVDRLSLMHSHRPDGKLTYTELLSLPLK